MSKKTEAKCQGMMLIAGFHSANPPLIWRFDLERNHSFTLSLQGEEGEWELGITTPKGEFYPVVHFVAREDAEEAFEKVERALAQKRSKGSQIAKAVTLVIMAALTIVLGVGLSAHFLWHRAEPLKATAIIPEPEIRNGIPLPADEVLKAPPP
jgi:hypothetical protein